MSPSVSGSRIRERLESRVGAMVGRAPRALSMSAAVMDPAENRVRAPLAAGRTRPLSAMAEPSTANPVKKRCTFVSGTLDTVIIISHGPTL